MKIMMSSMAISFLGAMAALNGFYSPTARAQEHVFITEDPLPMDSAAPVIANGFSISNFATGLIRPTAMEFAPDGRLFVLEQSGKVIVFDSAGNRKAQPFVSLTVDSSGERGLLGIAFHPSFSRNRFVYLYHTVPGNPAHNRVTRFTAQGDVAQPGSKKIIMDLNPLSSATNHNGGAIHFGNDGKLYIAVGENANPQNAQSLNNRLGKILRINADGSIPANNPVSFPGISGTTSGLNRAIWAVGLRNPFTFAFQPIFGKMFINDVGRSTWEEINRGIVASNYGWPLSEGPTANPDFKSPLFAYKHDGSTIPSGCAITGGAFYAPPNGIHTVRGAGADIGGTFDSFNYVYKTLSGDGTITVKLRTMTNTNSLAKAGVMIRTALTANSPHAFMTMTPTSGAFFYSRRNSGEITHTIGALASAATPRWLRITRTGNTVTGFISSNGLNFTKIGSDSIAMNANVFIGLAVTSRNVNVRNRSVFDHLSINAANVSASFSRRDIGSPALAGSYRFSQVQFPNSYNGHYFFADYCGGWIYEVDSANPSQASQFVTGLSGVVDLKSAPDGSLFYLARGTGSVARIRYTGASIQNIETSSDALDVLSATEYGPRR